MPLKIVSNKTSYLNDYLDSGDVTDVIECGKEKYPVDALCSDYRFVDAVDFVRRGYRMMHAGCFAQEFFDILYSLEGGSRIVSAGQNSEIAKAELVNLLIDEYEELAADEVYVIAEEMGRGLYEDFIRYAKLIESVRRDFPMVYQELLHCNNMRNHFLSILLLCGDATLARDFARDTGACIAFGEADKWEKLLDSASADIENSGIFHLFEKADDMSGQILNTIMRYNDKLISYELYWILNTLIAIRRTREYVHKQISLFDEVMDCGWESGLGYVVNPGVDAIIQDLEQGLRSYVPNQIQLGKILVVLIGVCGYHNHEFDDPENFLFEYWEEPQECDMAVLERVSDLSEKLGISKKSESDVKQFKECAYEWKKWYAMKDPEFGGPDENNLYIDKFERFMDYLFIFKI